MFMYQNLPQLISPYFLELGPIKLYWYGAMYVVAFSVCLALCVYRLKTESSFSFHKEQVYDSLIYGILGLVIGGRLGYVLFYNLPYFLAHPLEIILPFSGGQFVGISGMSYHGGLIGVIAALWWFCRKKGVDWKELFRLYIPTIPLAYTFGRIGNFLNGELYGRITTSPLGMDFGDGVLRHPSQLYEAFFEGIVLFLLLWPIRKKPWASASRLLGLYLLGYAIARIAIEFFREPDPQIGFLFGSFTLGQLLSATMVIAGIFLIQKK